MDIAALLDTPDFRRELALAAAEVPPEAPHLACRVADDGWRYRDDDEPSPLYAMPGWEPQRDHNWRWHHQSLSLAGAYLRLHKERNDHRAAPMIEALVADWAAHGSADPQFAWGEHSAALRLQRLVRLLGLFDAFTPGFRVFLVRLIDEHASRLLTDVARSRHNHALDQIYSLALARRHLPFLDIPRDELVARLAVERHHLLSAESVVTENSPGYQSWIPARIVECQRLLGLEPELDMLAHAQAFTDWMARPDGTWPQFGDTAPDKPAAATSRPVGFRAFPHAGYAVHRGDGVHLAIKCGFLSHAHRHADDGSFLLVDEDGDLFVEAGMFGYAKGWERDHARSPEAHNISYRVGANVIGSTTSRRYQRHRQRWGIVEAADGWRVDCRSFMFDDAVYSRRFSGSGGTIELLDRFDVPGTIRTRFHVPMERTVRIEPGCVHLGHATLSHDLPPPRLLQGVRTVGYLRYGPARTLEFDWPAGTTAARFTIRLHESTA